ncbi:MAG: peptidoglycan DD-metalloendopeptidase family protein, partial [Treponema sp.]|nr:peptidoglycan DD-metalloendopeptidase family protein [Treponema sp.]
DVKINGNNAATEGSVARHDNPIHNQLPGTIRFNRNPSNDGEVTGGTVRSVKINGKEAAVIGSTVTTCNDTGVRENSTVMAVGAHIPMPVIIHPKNTAAWKEERREQNPRNPEFTSFRTDKKRVKEGEEIEFIVMVKDIADGNMVTFQIFRRGQDPNTHVPLGRISVTIEGGMAKAKWQYSHPQGVELPADDLEFIATAHSAWCPPKQSDEFTVELRRPECTELYCEDKEGNRTGEAAPDETCRLVACFNEDGKDGLATFSVYSKGDEPRRDRPLEILTGAIEAGRAVVELGQGVWRGLRNRKNQIMGEATGFFFTVNSPRCKEAQSEIVEELDKTFNPYEGTGPFNFPATTSGNWLPVESVEIPIIRDNPGFAPTVSMSGDAINGEKIYDHYFSRHFSSPFGILRRGSSLRHNGIDIRTNGVSNMPTVALVYGKVWACSPKNQIDAIFGRFMFIRGTRDNNLYFISHLERFLKTEGAFVEPGEPVAITGNLGTSSGIHLHLEVFVNVPDTIEDVLNMAVIRGIRTNNPSRKAFPYYGAIVNRRRFDLDAHRRDPFNHNRRIANNGQPNSRVVIEGE